MKTLITTLAALTLLTAGFSAPAFAGDCKQVRFKICNESGTVINAQSFRIRGNDGTWTENIGNKRIEDSVCHTTAKRRLNQLDSGHRGRFTLNYKRLDRRTGVWKDRTLTRSRVMCRDGKTIAFTVR